MAAGFSAFMAPNNFSGSNFFILRLCLLPRVSRCTSSGRKVRWTNKGCGSANAATFFKVLVTGSGIMLGVNLLDLVKHYKNYFSIYLLHNGGQAGALY